MAISRDIFSIRKAVVDLPSLDFDLIGQNWEDNKTTLPWGMRGGGGGEARPIGRREPSRSVVGRRWCFLDKRLSISWRFHEQTIYSRQQMVFRATQVPYVVGSRSVLSLN